MQEDATKSLYLHMRYDAILSLGNNLTVVIGDLPDTPVITYVNV